AWYKPADEPLRVAGYPHSNRFRVSSERREARLRMPVRQGKEDRLQQFAYTSPQTMQNLVLHQVPTPSKPSTAQDQAILHAGLLMAQALPPHLLPQKLPLSNFEPSKLEQPPCR